MRLFSGQRAWMLQRVTAVALLVAIAIVAATLLIGPPMSYERWLGVATSPHGAVLIVLTFGALCLHGWVGLRDIVLDYVHPPGLRLALLSLAGLVLIAIMIRVLLTLAAHFIATGG